jgi:hypothetical protein
MPVREGFSLIPLNFSKIIVIPLKVSVLKDSPINLTKLGQIVVEIRCTQSGMSICEYESHIVLCQSMKGGYEEHDLAILALANATVPGLNIIRHYRMRRKIERDIIAQSASRRDRHDDLLTIMD